MGTNHLLRCCVPVGWLSSAFLVDRPVQQVQHLWKESLSHMFGSVANDPYPLLRRKNERSHFQDGQQVGCSLSKGIPQGFLSI